MMDHLTRFILLTPIPNKSADTVAKAIIDDIVGIFGPPEILHPDQGPEFENKKIYQLQRVLWVQENPDDTVSTPRQFCVRTYTFNNARNVSDA